MVRMASTSRSRAADRLRRWERNSAASMVIVVPARRLSRRENSRSRCSGVRAVLAPMSKLSWTRESVVLTPWPPGPDARANFSLSSRSGRISPCGIPGPGGTRRSGTTAG